MSVKKIFNSSLLTLVLCLTFFGFTFNASAQIDIPVKMNSKEYMPATPEAVALGQYGDVPVSYHTGVPNISIPIFTIPLRSFSLPISLSYHSGGIKVDQTASNVGLGWVLNAGGSISVNTLSKSDFNYPLWEVPPIPWSIASPVQAFSAYTPQSWYDMFNNPNLGYFFLLGFFAPSLNAEAKSANFEPDDISYNFGNYSGKFITRRDGRLEPMPKNGLRVTDNLDVIDESGNLYEFNAIDTLGGSDPFLASYSFWLTRVTTPDGETVEFAYESESQCYFSKSETQYALVPNSNGCTVPNEMNPVTYNRMGASAKVLKRITSSNGYIVDFGYHANSRVDLIGSHSLKEILVRYQINGDTTELTRFDLYHNDLIGGTTTTINCGNFGVDDIDFVSSYRLMLDSIKQSGLPPYRFTYNINALPARLSHKQDLWGYANENSYPSLVPIVPRIYRFEGADRTPDSIAMKAKVLEKIQYPTGGYTEFDFESHTYFTTGEEVIGYGSTSCAASSNENKTCYFTLPATAYGPVKIVFSFPAGTQAGIVHIPTNQTVLVDNTAYPLSETVMAPTPGNYSVTINNFGGSGPATMNFSWMELDSVHNVNRVGGGLRIKEIRNYSSAGQLSQKRRLSYNKPGTSVSSARSARIPVAYDHFAKRFIKWNPRVDPNYGSGPPYYNIDCYYSSIHSQDVSPDTRPVSTSFRYEFVTEMVDNGQFGKTVYQYNNTEDALGGASSAFPNEVSDAITSQLIKKSDYKFVSGTFTIVKKEELSYTNQLSSHLSYANGYKFELANGGQVNEVNGSVHYWIPAEFYFTAYNTQNLNANLAHKQVVQYLQDSVFQQHVYTYNEDNLLISDRLISAKDTIQTTYSYETLSIGGVSRTVNKPNLVRIMRIADVGSARAGGVSTAKAVDYQTVSGKFVPAAIYELENLAPIANAQVVNHLKSRVVFDSYDVNGNPQSMIDISGMRTSFIWGKNNLLMAQVINAPLNMIAHTSFENGDYGNFSISGSTSSYAGAKTGNRYLSSGSLSKSSLPSGTYRVTLWARKIGTGTLTINGTSLPVTGTDWTLLEHEFTGTSLTIVLSNCEVDEVRMFPPGAQMTTYTYRAGVGVSTIMDTNGVLQHYEYDPYGKLRLVRDANKNIVSQHLYNYEINND